MKNILVIEPDRLLATTYAKALENTNKFNVQIAHGAQAAIDAADFKKPDLVFLEIQLVGHSGIEFLYEFRSYPEWQNVPVVILSQVSVNEFLASYEILREQLGVEHYLYKPKINLKTLINITQDLTQLVTA